MNAPPDEDIDKRCHFFIELFKQLRLLFTQSITTE